MQILFKIITEESTQNVNSNTGILLVKQVLDAIFCMIGHHGYQLTNELKPGNQHSQKGFSGFLRRGVALARKVTGQGLLVHIDFMHDADDALATGFKLDDEAHSAVKGCVLAFIVKRNTCRKDRRTWIDQCNAEHAPRLHQQGRRPREGVPRHRPAHADGFHRAQVALLRLGGEAHDAHGDHIAKKKAKLAVAKELSENDSSYHTAVTGRGLPVRSIKNAVDVVGIFAISPLRVAYHNPRLILAAIFGLLIAHT